MSLLVSALIVILTDQVLKYAAFSFADSTVVISGVLRFTQVTNRGVAFGIGSNLESTVLGKYIFALLSLGIVVALLTLFARYCRTRLWARISLGLIVGGAISNLGDRFMFGHVRDFIDFTFWFTFNGADLAICAGVVLLIAGMLKEEADRKSASEPAATTEPPSSQRKD